MSARRKSIKSRRCCPTELDPDYRSRPEHDKKQQELSTNKDSRTCPAQKVDSSLVIAAIGFASTRRASRRSLEALEGRHRGLTAVAFCLLPPRREIRLPRAVDHPHQRRRPDAGPVLFAPDRRSQQGQREAGSEDPLRPGDQRSERLSESRRGGTKLVGSGSMPGPGSQEIIAELDRLATAFGDDVRSLENEQEIRAAQARYLGKKGKASELMKALGRMPPEDRPAVVRRPMRQGGHRGLVASRRRLCRPRDGRSTWLVQGVTLPGRGDDPVTLHPLTLVRRESRRSSSPRLRGPHRPLDRDRVEQLRRAEHPCRSSGARHAGHVLRRRQPILRSHTSPCRSAPCSRSAPIKIIAPGEVSVAMTTHDTPMFPRWMGSTSTATSRSRRSRGRCCTSCGASLAARWGSAAPSFSRSRSHRPR